MFERQLYSFVNAKMGSDPSSFYLCFCIQSSFPLRHDRDSL
jgi:hypothetical protein